jgi:hypothetical protein
MHRLGNGRSDGRWLEAGRRMSDQPRRDRYRTRALWIIGLTLYVVLLLVMRWIYGFEDSTLY